MDSAVDGSPLWPLGRIALLLDPVSLTALAAELDRLAGALRDVEREHRGAAGHAATGPDPTISGAIVTAATWADDEARDLTRRIALTQGRQRHQAAVTLSFSGTRLDREIADGLTALVARPVLPEDALPRLRALVGRIDRLTHDPEAAAAALLRLGPEHLLRLPRLLRWLGPHAGSPEEISALRDGIARLVAAASRAGTLPADWLVQLLAVEDHDPRDIAALLTDGDMALTWLLPLASAVLGPAARTDGPDRWPAEIAHDREARAVALRAVVRHDAAGALLRHLPDAAALTRDGYADLGDSLGRVIAAGLDTLGGGGDTDLHLARVTTRQLVAGVGEHGMVEPLALAALLAAVGRWPSALVPDRPGFDDSPGGGALDDDTLRAGLEPLVADAIPPELLDGIAAELTTLVRMHFTDAPEEAGRRMHEITALLGVVLDTHLDGIHGDAVAAGPDALAGLLVDVAASFARPAVSVAVSTVGAASTLLGDAEAHERKALDARPRLTVAAVERELLWSLLEIARREVPDLPPPPTEDGALIHWWEHDPAVVGTAGPRWEAYHRWRGHDDVEDRVNDLESRLRATAWELLSVGDD